MKKLPGTGQDFNDFLEEQGIRKETGKRAEKKLEMWNKEATKNGCAGAGERKRKA